MGVGRDGRSPCFLVDDKWSTRKPPHLGIGDDTEHERRAYWPQWVQHGFYHHIFLIHPDLKLKAQGHRWLDQNTWAADFSERIEPDNYHQALHKRFRTPKANPRMVIALHYAAPPADFPKRLTLADVAEVYSLQVPENESHRGTISMENVADGREVLRWKNAAGVTWGLAPDLASGLLNTGMDNPYLNSGETLSRLISC